MTRRRSVFALIAIVSLASLASPLPAAETPGKVIVQTIDEGLAILNDPQLRSPEMMPERRQRLWDAVKKVFSFEETAKRALGRHWNDRTPQERQDFTETFKNVLKSIYLDKSDTYHQESILYVDESVMNDRSKVHTFFTTSDGKQIAVDFSMMVLGGEWKIYDVVVEGVSIVGNYRSQFNSILSKSSFAELMDKLREKESAAVPTKD